MIASLKIIGVFGIAAILMMRIALSLLRPTVVDWNEVNREHKAGRLPSCPRVVGPAVAYDPCAR
jgi:hypothetical protein